MREKTSLPENRPGRTIELLPLKRPRRQKPKKMRNGMRKLSLRSGTRRTQRLKYLLRSKMRSIMI